MTKAKHATVEWRVHYDIDSDQFEHIAKYVVDGHWMAKHHRWLEVKDLPEEDRAQMLTELMAQVVKMESRRG